MQLRHSHSPPQSCLLFEKPLSSAQFLIKSKLPKEEVEHFWKLVDSRERGRMSLQEFCVLMHLVTKRKGGKSLPTELPPELRARLAAASDDPPPPAGYDSRTPKGFDSKPRVRSKELESERDRPLGSLALTATWLLCEGDCTPARAEHDGARSIDYIEASHVTFKAAGL